MLCHDRPAAILQTCYAFLLEQSVAFLLTMRYGTPQIGYMSLTDWKSSDQIETYPALVKWLKGPRQAPTQ